MGIMEKIANAKKTNWVSEGISEAEIKTTVELAKISAKIERSRQYFSGSFCVQASRESGHFSDERFKSKRK